ncbi:MAG: sulfite exporter TauE/SafE family protein [Solirubrobacteraceae bacterium]|nr:sulfite exporter TauE/SafE family protein [Solirubrobacteraceae bacterium]
MTVTPPSQPGRARTGTLLLIGSAAGIYSGLFGVGGGSVMVPLLILLLAYDPREATATSLAAIVVIATAGALTHAIYANVDWAVAAVVAVPAVVGAVVGTALQQRVPREWITTGLALLLIVGAIDLLRGL